MLWRLLYWFHAELYRFHEEQSVKIDRLISTALIQWLVLIHSRYTVSMFDLVSLTPFTLLKKILYTTFSPFQFTKIFNIEAKRRVSKSIHSEFFFFSTLPNLFACSIDGAPLVYWTFRLNTEPWCAVNPTRWIPIWIYHWPCFIYYDCTPFSWRSEPATRCVNSGCWSFELPLPWCNLACCDLRVELVQGKAGSSWWRLHRNFHSVAVKC